jgi:hypothetical protein
MGLLVGLLVQGYKSGIESVELPCRSQVLSGPPP